MNEYCTVEGNGETLLNADSILEAFRLLDPVMYHTVLVGTPYIFTESLQYRNY